MTRLPPTPTREAVGVRLVYTVDEGARGLVTPGTRIGDEDRGTAYPVTGGAT